MMFYLLAFCLVQDVPDFRSQVDEVSNVVTTVDGDTVVELSKKVDINTANIDVNSTNIKTNAENIEKIVEQLKKPKIATGFTPPRRATVNSFRSKPVSFNNNYVGSGSTGNSYTPSVRTFTGDSYVSNLTPAPNVTSFTGDSYVPDLTPAPIVISGGSTGNVTYSSPQFQTRTIRRMPVQQTFTGNVQYTPVQTKRTLLPGKFRAGGGLLGNRY
jgi:CheY-specific phosphatase CheX